MLHVNILIHFLTVYTEHGQKIYVKILQNLTNKFINTYFAQPLH